LISRKSSSGKVSTKTWFGENMSPGQLLPLCGQSRPISPLQGARFITINVNVKGAVGVSLWK